MSHDKWIARIDAHREWIQSAGERGSQLDLDNINMTAVDLRGFPFEQSYLAACKLNGLRFKDVDFYEAEFYSCDFTEAWFVGCSFRKATLDYCDFRCAHFVRCEFPRTEIYHSCFSNCCFEDSSFSGIDLMGCDLSDATFCSIDWDGAYLSQVNFRNAIGRASKNISTIVQPKIAIASTQEDWLEGQSAIEWLQDRMNSGGGEGGH